MPTDKNSFWVSDGPTKVAVKNDGKPNSQEPRIGSAQYTVQNSSNAEVTVQLSVKVGARTSTDWFSFTGGTLRTIPAGTNQTCQLNISVPASVAAGSYSFSLLVDAESDTDNRSAESPSAVIEVEGPAAKTNYWPWIIGAVILLLVLAAGAWWLLRPKDTVPDLFNKPLTEAQALATSKKFKLDPTPGTPGGKPKDTIVDQTPKAGEAFGDPRVIKVTYDPGVQPSVAPDFLSSPITVDDARGKATAFDFAPVAAPAPTGKKPNTIIDQTPKPGQPLAPGAILKVVYDPGLKVPTLKDRGFKIDGALAELQRVSPTLHIVRISEVCRTAGLDGEVIDQSPAPDTVVSSITELTVTTRRLSNFCLLLPPQIYQIDKYRELRRGINR